jgi:hypothetical protein
VFCGGTAPITLLHTHNLYGRMRGEKKERKRKEVRGERKHTVTFFRMSFVVKDLRSSPENGTKTSCTTRLTVLFIFS